MASDTTEAALGLLGAVQDPKATKKILDEIKAEQTKLERAREDFAGERRECMEIWKQQRRDANKAEDLATQEAALALATAKLKDDREAHDKNVKSLADINEARKQAENKTAYAKRQTAKLEKQERAVATLAEHNKNVVATARAKLAELSEQLAKS